MESTLGSSFYMPGANIETDGYVEFLFCQQHWRVRLQRAGR